MFPINQTDCMIYQKRLGNHTVDVPQCKSIPEVVFGRILVEIYIQIQVTNEVEFSEMIHGILKKIREKYSEEFLQESLEAILEEFLKEFFFRKLCKMSCRNLRWLSNLGLYLG